MFTPASLYILRNSLNLSIDAERRQSLSLAAAASCSGVIGPRPPPPPPRPPPEPRRAPGGPPPPPRWGNGAPAKVSAAGGINSIALIPLSTIILRSVSALLAAPSGSPR